MITVEATDEEFHVTVTRAAVDERAFATFVAWLRNESAARDLVRRPDDSRSLTAIAAASRMTESEADALADDLVAGRLEVARRLQQAAPGEFFAPFHLLAELFEHKERILRLTALAPDDIVAAFHQLAESITFVREASITLGIWVEAHRLCRGVDADDTPYVARTGVDIVAR